MSHLFFCGEGFSRACSETFKCCAGMARRRGRHTLRGNSRVVRWGELGRGAKTAGHPEREWSPTLENFLGRPISPAHFVGGLSGRRAICIKDNTCMMCASFVSCTQQHVSKLTWLVLGGDPAARSRRVEQLTAL